MVHSKGKVISYYSQNLESIQYSFIRSTVKIYNDHNNQTCKYLNKDRVFWWILIIEQYIPDIEYISGNKNIALDDLSRLPNNVNQDTIY